MVIRGIILVAGIWLIMLFSGYGILTGSHKIAAGLGLSCQYLTAKGMTVARYLHSDSGITGKASCPWLRKDDEMVLPVTGG